MPSLPGLGGSTVPRERGGVSYARLAEVFVILSAADASLGQLPQNHFVWTRPSAWGVETSKFRH